MATKNRLGLLALAALVLSFAMPAAAQDYAVVRYTQGRGFVQAADEQDPQVITANTPLIDGDNLWTETGRLGLLLQDGNRFWMNENTRMEIDQFPGTSQSSGRTFRCRLWKGSALVDMESWSSGRQGYLVSTPSASIIMAQEGIYLLEIETVDRTRVTCLKGRCAVSSGGQTAWIERGETTYAEYGYTPVQPVAYSGNNDLLGYRNQCLKERKSAPASRQYIDPDLYAYAADLDDYGSWSEVPDYGYCWTPSQIDAGWAPYTYGRWCDSSDWGLTWVPYEPWGWLPFHYGNWVWGGGLGWSWCPGPYFAPAWVSWYWGDGWLGWCPLDYWGSPYWGSCGWNSIDIVNIYGYDTPRALVHHRDAPTPTPIYPRPVGKQARVTAGSADPRVQGHSTGMRVSRSSVKDYKDGRISQRDLQSKAMEPRSQRAAANPAARPAAPDRDRQVLNPRSPAAKARPGRDGATSDRSTGAPMARDRQDRPTAQPSRPQSRSNGDNSIASPENSRKRDSGRAITDEDILQAPRDNPRKQPRRYTDEDLPRSSQNTPRSAPQQDDRYSNQYRDTQRNSQRTNPRRDPSYRDRSDRETSGNPGWPWEPRSERPRYRDNGGDDRQMYAPRSRDYSDQRSVPSRPERQAPYQQRQVNPQRSAPSDRPSYSRPAPQQGGRSESPRSAPPRSSGSGSPHSSSPHYSSPPSHSAPSHSAPSSPAPQSGGGRRSR